MFLLTIADEKKREDQNTGAPGPRTQKGCRYDEGKTIFNINLRNHNWRCPNGLLINQKK
jgi:hypothetical protein